MWQDYEATYREELQEPTFVAWRELGARRKAENILRVCRGVNPISVIEIGCGTGAVLRMLHSMNFARDYFCMDLSPSASAFARDGCPALSGHTVAGQAEALGFADNAFEVAILSHVIEHMEDPLAALREASRVARFVVVEVPTEKVLINTIRTRVLRRPYPSMAAAGHVQFWGPSSITTFLKAEAGLEIVARHRDLLDEEIDSASSNGHGARQALKRSLRMCLPSRLYASLLTTHATFLCRRPACPVLSHRPHERERLKLGAQTSNQSSFVDD